MKLAYQLNKAVMWDTFCFVEFWNGFAILIQNSLRKKCPIRRRYTYVVLALFNGTPTNPIDVVGVSLFFSLWGLIIAYPAALFLGVPTMLLLNRYKKQNYFSVVLSGIAWSIPIALSFGIDTSSTIFVSYCSAIVASGCWLVYRYV